ncbi:MAG: hypothetical protein AAGD14_12840 [Planctomycetota bacterium]
MRYRMGRFLLPATLALVSLCPASPVVQRAVERGLEHAEKLHADGHPRGQKYLNDAVAYAAGYASRDKLPVARVADVIELALEQAGSRLGQVAVDEAAYRRALQWYAMWEAGAQLPKTPKPTKKARLQAVMVAALTAHVPLARERSVSTTLGYDAAEVAHEFSRRKPALSSEEFEAVWKSLDRGIKRRAGPEATAMFQLYADGLGGASRRSACDAIAKGEPHATVVSVYFDRTTESVARSLESARSGGDVGDTEDDLRDLRRNRATWRRSVRGTSRVIQARTQSAASYVRAERHLRDAKTDVQRRMARIDLEGAKKRFDEAKERLAAIDRAWRPTTIR